MRSKRKVDREMKKDFKWVIHTTSQGDKAGVKKRDFQLNEKLPTEYRGNPNFDLELQEIYLNEKNTYKKKDLKITKLKAQFLEPGEPRFFSTRGIPYNYFQSSIVWLLVVSIKESFSHWR